jgi:RNA-directed DNA polymerase
VSFRQIEQEGVNGWLEELAKELQEKTYRPQAVRRVWIPKPGTDKQRPLGVPCIKNRVGMAAVTVLEPIFEADLPEEPYGYRHVRSAHDAIRSIHGLLNQGHPRGNTAQQERPLARQPGARCGHGGGAVLENA